MLASCVRVRWRRALVLLALAAPLPPLALAAAAEAATIGPPMFDVAKQCDAGTRSATAMSECVVAESEARAELLTNWSKYSDAEAGKCIKAARKAKRSPYEGMLKCLAPAPVETGAAPAAVPAAAAR